MKLLYRVFALLLFVLPVQAVMAQQDIPSLPPPLQTLADEGAQIRFLGRDHGYDAWLTVKGGQEQYFYVKPDGSAFVMGLLFDAKGRLVTVDQVAALQKSGDAVLDGLAGEVLARRGATDGMDAAALNTPAEQLFADIEASNWVAVGNVNAPVIYSFIDPQCPHCHAFINDVRGASVLADGRVQLRLIPIGLQEQTRAQAAFLMAAPNPQERLFEYLDGNEAALPAKPEINQQGVQRNLAIMQSWKLASTPLSVYRDRNGQVKIIQGRPKDLNEMIKDLAG